MHKILLKTPFNVLKMLKMKKKQKPKWKGKETLTSNWISKFTKNSSS